MTLNQRATRHSVAALVLLLFSVSIAAGSASFFAYRTRPFPYAARSLISPGAPVSLDPHQLLIEGYTHNRRGRPVRSVAIYPGEMNAVAEEIPGSLAVTDSNGFFSIIVDRDRYTHLVAVCLPPLERSKKVSPVRSLVVASVVVLPKADVSQAERTFRLDIPRRAFRCVYPIEGPPSGIVFFK